MPAAAASASRWRLVLAIFVGGAVGTVLRLGAIALLGGTSFPAATLSVNLLGSFSLGLLYELAARTQLVGPTLRFGVGVGLLGGFTTYATFNQEALALAATGAGVAAALYTVGTLVGGLVAGFLGMSLARRLAAPGAHR